MRDPELWARLEAFLVGGPGFADRLAREAGWTAEHAAAAIQEYKRFLYLTQVAPGEMTPSRDVDRVWHQHLIYTRNYWQVLCDVVLLRALHHNPAPPDKTRRHYAERYARTLAAYRDEFGQPAPRAIWRSAGDDRLLRAARWMMAAGSAGMAAGVVLWLWQGLAAAAWVTGACAALALAGAVQAWRHRDQGRGA